MQHDNIILIGMPGCGKSTIGVVLAKAIGYHFTDTDLLIQSTYGCKLQELIDWEGAASFLRKEEETVLAFQPEHTVVATGGSVVYSEAAMRHLADRGTVVYLRRSLDEILSHLGDWSRRGIALPAGMGIDGLYAERTPLYERYAQVTVDCEGKEISGIVREIEAALGL